jgi:alkylated DNA repair dioxygenase AlkB
MPLRTIDLPDADVALDPAWLPAAGADALFAQLQSDIAWEVHRIRLFGRMVDSPRLSCWIGEADAAYAYSGTRFDPRPWPSSLLPVRERLQRETGIAFNSALANLYRDGRDRMGWHSDNEPELGPRPVIASLSLGASRRFVFRHRSVASLQREIILTHGSLLLMGGDTQAHYRHALPASARVHEPRINLTFRQIVAPVPVR